MQGLRWLARSESRQICLLRIMKTNRKRLSLYFVSLALILVVSQIAFFYFQNIQSQKSVMAVQALLRQEVSSSNTFLIARTLSDLEGLGLLKCAKLTEAKSGQVHLDLTFKDNCEHNPWLLSGKKVNVELESLNGTKWLLDFESVNGGFFLMSLWLFRVLLGSVAIYIISIYFRREEKIFREAQKKEKLKDLANQAAHDVVSPLTLLHSLRESDLVSPEARVFLEKCIERVQGIVGNLREQSELIEDESSGLKSRIELSKIVDEVVQEKRVFYPSILWRQSAENIVVLANEGDLKRVLSNLLNNAIEASKDDSPIEVTVTNNMLSSVLHIKDHGNGIDPKIVPLIGKKGATFGKGKGSGLGLFHAKSCLDAWGGELKIESEVGVGTTVLLHFIT